MPVLPQSYAHGKYIIISTRQSYPNPNFRKCRKDIATLLYLSISKSLLAGIDLSSMTNQKIKVLLRANCSHGQGGGSTMRNPVFSNQPSSNCSSLGRYKIVSPGRMSNGYPSYVLEGLDPTNSNARMRQILIHPSKVVSAFGFGAYPFYLPLKKVSSGCFTISFFNFKKLRHIIDRETKPVMLIAYY